MSTSTANISLGMQTSREDNRTQTHILVLRKLMETHCRGQYSPDIKEFALILRIGGEMQEFNFEGCERLRRNRKDKYITVDLGFPSYRWRGISDAGIRQYLAEAVETGLLCCIRRLEKDKTPVDSQKLMADYNVAKRLFLSPYESTCV
jgi:hypothetical protein